MKSKITLLVGLAYAVILSSCTGEKLQQRINSKPIAAQYTGGHYDYATLVLYSDSTFFYVYAPHMMPFLQNRLKGSYTRDTSSILLIAKRRWDHFWKKPPPVTFRIRGNQVLMYSEEQENSENGDFIKAYHTLTLEQ